MGQLFGSALLMRAIPRSAMRKLGVLALLALALGCGGSRSGGGAAEPGGERVDTPGASEQSRGAEAPAGVAAPAGSIFNLPADISTWSTWDRAGEFVSGKGHGESFVEIRVHGGADAYRALSADATAPEGMVVVKAQHTNVGGSKGEPLRLAVMAKMETGFAPDHGNWYYGVWSYDGTDVVMEGKGEGDTELCLSCHDTADSDYLFGIAE